MRLCYAWIQGLSMCMDAQRNNNKLGICIAMNNSGLFHWANEELYWSESIPFMNGFQRMVLDNNAFPLTLITKGHGITSLWMTFYRFAIQVCIYVIYIYLSLSICTHVTYVCDLVCMFVIANAIANDLSVRSIHAICIPIPLLHPFLVQAYFADTYSFPLNQMWCFVCLCDVLTEWALCCL